MLHEVRGSLEGFRACPEHFLDGILGLVGRHPLLPSEMMVGDLQHEAAHIILRLESVYAGVG